MYYYNVTKFALNNRRSVLDRNFRYLAFKYKMKCSSWYTNGSYININMYELEGCIEYIAFYVYVSVYIYIYYYYVDLYTLHNLYIYIYLFQVSIFYLDRNTRAEMRRLVGVEHVTRSGKMR